MTCQNIEQELWNMTYSNNNDFLNHITIIYNKWAYANTLGITISDISFKTIILNVLDNIKELNKVPSIRISTLYILDY